MPSCPSVARLAALSAVVTLAACGGGDDAARVADSLRADSARVAAAAADSARQAEQLAQVDTALAPSLEVDLARFERRPSGLYVRELRRGSGAVADSGKWVSVDYTTWLADGTVVDDTRKAGGEPQRVLLGYGRVIKGWEEGMRGMREGGRRMLVVPPALAYGVAGRPGTVPSRATLVFDIEVRKVY